MGEVVFWGRGIDFKWGKCYLLINMKVKKIKINPEFEIVGLTEKEFETIKMALRFADNYAVDDPKLQHEFLKNYYYYKTYHYRKHDYGTIYRKLEFPTL